MRMKLYQAAQQILISSSRPLHPREIYERIVEQGLFQFGARDPVSVVSSTLRRRCTDMVGPDAAIFEKVGKNLYQSRR